MSNIFTIIVSILSSTLLATIISLIFQVRLEKRKAELERESKRREILLSKLRKQQAEVFKKFYEKLVRMYNALWSATLESKNPKEDEAKFEMELESALFGEAAKSFWIFFQSNKIFIPADLCEMTEKFHIQVGTAFHRLKHPGQDEEERASRYSLWQQCDVIKSDIEKRFRIILGVDGLYDAALK